MVHKSERDNARRNRQLERKEQKKQERLDKKDLKQALLSRRLELDEPELSDNSIRGSRATSRVTSRNVSPHSASRVGSDGEDSHFLSPKRRGGGGSRMGSRVGSRVGSRAQSSEDSDDELANPIESLEGIDLLRHIIQMLRKRGKASTHYSKQDVLVRVCKLLRREVFDVETQDGLSVFLHGIPVSMRLFETLQDGDRMQIPKDQAKELHKSLSVLIRTPGSPEEMDHALQAFAMLAITLGTDEGFLSKIGLLKEVITNTSNKVTKAWAIYTLAIVVRFGDAQQETLEKLLEYFIEIVQSDGASVEAHDSSVVVCAAMEAWAFVATFSALHSHSVDAMEAFMEQLDSTETSVQVLAASNIALMFDISRQMRELAEDEAGKDEEPDVEEMLVLYEDPKRIAHRIRSLSKDTSVLRQKSERVYSKAQLEFAATSLELDVGYGYKTETQLGKLSVNDGAVHMGDSRFHRGYSESIRLIGQYNLAIKSWAAWSRIKLLKKVLGNGFPNHFVGNVAVRMCLDDDTLVVQRGETWDGEGQVDEESTAVNDFWENEAIAEEVEE